MKSLIVEDNFLNRLSLQQILTPYGETHVAVNGEEAVEAFTMALDDKKPYNLICLDIRLPEMDGQAVLKEIRSIEAERSIHGLDGVKIIMTTALGDSVDIMEAFKNQCEAYLVKPFDEKKLINHLKNFGLID